MSNRLDQDRERELQPKRMEVAIAMIRSRNLEIKFQDSTTVKFLYKNNIITFYPYSGWHTGRGIKDGRGLENLLKQLI